MKFIFHNTTYIPLDSVRYRESGSTKMIEEENKKNLVNTNLYFSNQNSFTIFKNPPRRFRFNFILFIIREAQIITSIYQVTTMEQLETLIFDAIIKLRSNEKQPNKNSIHILISKDCKSLSKK